MLYLDELEKLSRFASGDLPADEAGRVKSDLQRRPELARALEQLSRLDAAAKALPETLSADQVDEIIRGVPRPGRARLNPGPGLAAAALAVLLGGAALWLGLGRDPRPRLVALAGSVTVDGASIRAPSEALTIAPGVVVRSGSESAAIIETRQATLLLARKSQLALPPKAQATFELSTGTLAATGREIRLAAGGTRVQLTGRGVVSWEPEEMLARVTDAMEANPSPLGFKWLKLPLAATAVAAVGVTVLVLEGKARVTTDATPPVDVAAGQKWSTGNPRPTAINGAALSASKEPAPPKPEPSATGAAAPGSSSLATLSREQLVAEVVRLRAQNNALAERNQEIQKKLEDSDPKTRAKKENYYRTDPDELRAMAERGEMRLHTPPTLGGHSIYDPRVASDLGLTAEEESKIREIYESSARNIREGLISLYVEIGGDRNVGSALDAFALMQELQTKTPDRDAVVRAATRERGGLEQPGNPNQGPALLRFYRLLFREEDRVLAELDALLGPDRAEQFVNHPNTSHSTWSTTSSAPPRP